MRRKSYQPNKSILEAKNAVAVLIDPDKFDPSQDSSFVKRLNFSQLDFIFIGGSTVHRDHYSACVEYLKANTKIPLIGFPGDVYQYHEKLDALLYLSLLSGRNPDYLIGQHVKTSKEILSCSFDTIPTAYLLIDGGKTSATAYVSQTTPLPQDQIDLIERTAIAGILQGKECIYLDAGSGAEKAVNPSILKRLKPLNKTLIVGGGVRTIEEIQDLHEAGANIVVIGNHLEENHDFLLDLHQYCEGRKD